MSKLLDNPDLEASNEALNYALSRAVEANDVLLIEKFAKRIIDGGQSIDDYVVAEAMKSTVDTALKAIAPYVDWAMRHKNDLLAAADNGRLDLVDVLLPYSDPTYLDDAALRWAAQQGHSEVVRRLAPLSGISLKNNEALAGAIDYNHWDIVEILAPYSNMNALNRFTEDDQARVLTLVEHSILQTHTHHTAPKSRTRRI